MDMLFNLWKCVNMCLYRGMLSQKGHYVFRTETEVEISFFFLAR